MSSQQGPDFAEMDIDPELDQSNSNLEIEHPVTVSGATLDLDNITASFLPPINHKRLLYISERCPALKTEALRMILSILLKGIDIDLYISTYKLLKDHLEITGNLSDLPEFKNDWVEEITARNKKQYDALEDDVKSYKNNSIKESIRRGYCELAEQLVLCGQYATATRYLMSARDYVTLPEHTVLIYMNIMRVAVYSNSWDQVNGNVFKLVNYPSGPNAEDDITMKREKARNKLPKTADKSGMDTIRSRIKICDGLVHLHKRGFEQCALKLSEVPFDSIEQPTDLLTVSNIATYTILCALATFDRKKLGDLLASVNMKLYLESESDLRDISNHFYESRYSDCLALLERIKPNLLLDIYLGQYVEDIYRNIVERAIIQYFLPFSTAHLPKMAETFNYTVPDLITQLIPLIQAKKIAGRIDVEKGVLVATTPSHQKNIVKKCMETSVNMEFLMREIILKAALSNANICIKDDEADDHGMQKGVPLHGTQ